MISCILHPLPTHDSHTLPRDIDLGGDCLADAVLGALWALLTGQVNFAHEFSAKSIPDRDRSSCGYVRHPYQTAARKYRVCRVVNVMEWPTSKNRRRRSRTVVVLGSSGSRKW